MLLPWRACLVFKDVKLGGATRCLPLYGTAQIYGDTVYHFGKLWRKFTFLKSGFYPKHVKKTGKAFNCSQIQVTMCFDANAGTEKATVYTGKYSFLFSVLHKARYVVVCSVCVCDNWFKNAETGMQIFWLIKTITWYHDNTLELPFVLFGVKVLYKLFQIKFMFP